MPRFNSINFYQNGPKVKLFLPKKLPKIKFFFRKTKSAPRPPTSGSWRLHLQTLQTAPLIANSWLPDSAPRGANRGRAPPTDCLCPPNKNCAPPSEDCAPKKLTGSWLLERKLRSKLVFFVDWYQILWRFWDEDLFFFFLENTWFWPEKPLEILISAGKPLAISVKTFFFLYGDHLISAGKTAWISNFGRKIPLTFCSSPCLFDPDWDKFLVPLSNSLKINFSCPSKIYFCPPPPPPPSHAILAPGLLATRKFWVVRLE